MRHCFPALKMPGVSPEYLSQNLRLAINRPARVTKQFPYSQPTGPYAQTQGETLCNRQVSPPPARSDRSPRRIREVEVLDPEPPGARGRSSTLPPQRSLLRVQD